MNPDSLESNSGLETGFRGPFRHTSNKVSRDARPSLSPAGGEAVKELACRDQFVTKGSLGGKLPTGKAHRGDPAGVGRQPPGRRSRNSA